MRKGLALPLSEILSDAARQWGGRIIDAKLVRLNDVLLYRLTLLSDEGVSRRVYYLAKSGNPVELH